MKKCSSRCKTGEQRGVWDNVVRIRYKQWGDKEMMLAWQREAGHLIWGTFLEEVILHLTLAESCISDDKQVF